MNEEISCTPPELKEVAQSVVCNLLPKKFRPVYEKKFKNVQVYLKTLSKGYEPEKSKILDSEDINRFINSADDGTYLAIKVVLILGFSGACTREELTNMLIDHIEIKSDVIMVSISKTTKNMPRLLAVTEELWIRVIKKYVNLRPTTVTHGRLLLTYRSGYCINSPIGINTIGKMPNIVASYLKLPNPEHYTGHCFRRSSVTHLANRGGDLVTIKRHGGWKSSVVAEGYIETSVKRKIELAKMFSSEPSTSNSSGGTSASNSSSQYDTNAVIESSVNQNVERNFVSAQNLPAHLTINAHDTSNVTSI